MSGKWVGVIAIVVVFVGFAAACAPTSPSSVSALTVSGAAPVVGATSQLTATATLADGTTQNVSSQATWQSSDTAIAAISSTGIVTGLASGTTMVQATYLTVTGSAQIVIP